MPGGMTLLPNSKFQVMWGGKITAKETTYLKGMAQLRLLQYEEDKKHPGSAFRRREKEKRDRRKTIVTKRIKTQKMVPGRRVRVKWSQLSEKQKEDVKRRFSPPYQRVQTGEGRYKLYYYYAEPDGSVKQRRFG